MLPDKENERQQKNNLLAINRMHIDFHHGHCGRHYATY